MGEDILRNRRSILVAAVAAGSVLSAWGCASIIGADFDAHLATTDGVPDAMTIADVGAAPDTAAPVLEAGCMHALPPDKPADASAAGNIEFSAALYSIDYGDEPDDAGKPAYVNIGFDLDNRCRGMETLGCKVGPMVGLEGTDGRDNAGGGLIFQIKQLVGTFAAGVGSVSDTQNIQSGAYTLIFHVTGYNGLADDSDLSVEWYAGAPFNSNKDAGAKPRWNGDDDWPASKVAVVDAGNGTFKSGFVTSTAYVTNHVLVANLAEAKLAGGSIPFDLVQIVITATVSPTETEAGAKTWALTNGVIGGRWKSDQILAAIPLFQVNFPQYLCQVGGLFYGQAKTKVCAAQDISDGVDLGANTPCDALSVGIDFTTVPVKFPSVAVLVPVPEGGCPAAPADSCNNAN